MTRYLERTMNGHVSRRRFLGGAGGAALGGALAPFLGSSADARFLPDAKAVVETTAGKIRGGVADGVFIFRGVPYGAQYREGHRRILVENGILNADFSPNEQTAVRLGWSLRNATQEDLSRYEVARSTEVETNK